MGLRNNMRILADPDAFAAGMRQRVDPDYTPSIHKPIIASAERHAATVSDSMPNLGQHRAEYHARPLPYSADRTLVASGQRINLRSSDEIAGLRNRVYTEWQNDAWAYYDAIGEIKFGLGIVGSCMSRIRLYPSVIVDEEAVPMPVAEIRDEQRQVAAQGEPANVGEPHPMIPEGVTPEVLDYMDRLMRDLRSGNGGQSGMLRMFALNLSIAGECYLVQIDGRWSVKSTSELIVNQGGQIILRSQRASSSTTSAGTVYGDVILKKSTPVYRIWREHPRYSSEPESSMLGIREPCDELITLQRMIRTIARSRMNAGLLYIPDGLRVAGASVAEDIATEEEEWDALVAAIYDAITAPIVDEANSASVVPTLLTGPGDEAKNLVHIQVNREIDQWLAERLDKALDRILSGLDLPKDVVTGYKQVKYTNAQKMSEAMYTEHIEPMALIFCDSLASMYMRPMLKRKFPHLSEDDLDALGVWYDPSELVIKPDDSESANKGYDNFALSGDAWRRANGFSDTDAPSERELAIRYMLTKGTPQPEQMSTLFKTAFPGIVDAARAANVKESPVPMPESAQQLLYGQVIAPASESTRDENAAPETAADVTERGANGGAPTTDSSTTTTERTRESGKVLRNNSVGSDRGYSRGTSVAAGRYAGGL